ncbi:MAG: oligosaccharide flippase family protein [Candidatus Lokiarchaeota archaeon]|nr:oligosaccharide flippase family protein [Candidatus Lokiarchaeota archaeon]
MRTIDMLTYLKQTAKHTIVYSVGNLSNKLIGFILLPIYTSYLTLSDYGVFGILEVTMQILAMVFNFGLPLAMLRWCAEESDKKKEKSIVFTTFSSLVFLMILFNLSFIPFKNQFSILFFDNSDFAIYFVILFLAVSLEIVGGVPLNLFRLQEKSLSYIVIVSLKLILVLSLNIYFVAITKIGVLGIFISRLIGNAFLLILTAPYIYKNSVFKFDFSKFLEMFKYSFPLIFLALSNMLLLTSNRYILKYFHNYEIVGIYTLGDKVARFISVFFLQSFMTGFSPMAFKMFNQPNAKRFFSKVLTYLCFGIIYASLGFSLFSEEIIKLMAKNKDYWIAYKIIPILTIPALLKAIQYILSLAFHFAKKNKYNAYISTAGLIINFGLNIIIIPIYSYWGAAVSTIVSMFIMSILYYNISQKHFKVNYELGKIVKMFSIALILFIAISFLDIRAFYLESAVKMTALLLFPFILYFMNFYDEIELIRIREIWINWIKIVDRRKKN